MSFVIDESALAHRVADAVAMLAVQLPDDIEEGLKKAFECEDNPRGQVVLSQLLDNARLAREYRAPICQDTGTVWVCIELGEDVSISGSCVDALNNAVADAYKEHHLRMSVVYDALVNRSNTNTNTPCFIDVRFVKGTGARVHVMLKGGGSDNASRLVMLPPSAQKQGIKEQVLELVFEKAANACPPLLIGIGIGSTFDHVGSLAKLSLMRKIGQRNPHPEIASFELELLDAVNATGLGPGALGGKTLALDVHIETDSCHIAALPLAINMGCCAMRRTSFELTLDNGGLR